MKVFDISMPRCGTMSTYQFFKQLGLSAKHVDATLWDSYCGGQGLRWNNVNKHTAFGDLPFPLPEVYIQCKEKFPESKFLLHTRPVDDWLRSIEAL